MKRILADAKNVSSTAIKVADGAAGRCKVCQAPDKAPHFHVAGTSPVSPFSEKAVDHAVALHAMDLYSEYSLLVLDLVSSESPLKFRAPSRAHGLRHSASLDKKKWTMVGNGRMDSGRTFARKNVYDCNF